MSIGYTPAIETDANIIIRSSGKKCASIEKTITLNDITIHNSPSYGKIWLKGSLGTLSAAPYAVRVIRLFCAPSEKGEIFIIIMPMDTWKTSINAREKIHNLLTSCITFIDFFVLSLNPLLQTHFPIFLLQKAHHPNATNGRGIMQCLIFRVHDTV